MADQIRLLWKDITEGEDDSPVLLVESICDVETADLSLPSNKVNTNVFDTDLSSPMSNVISDYSLSQIQVEDEQDVMNEEIEIPQRISIPPGHHSEESRSLIKKSVQYLDTLDEATKSIAWSFKYCVYRTGRNYSHVPMNYWGEGLKNRNEILMFPHDLAPGHFHESWTMQYHTQIIEIWKYIISSFDQRESSLITLSKDEVRHFYNDIRTNLNLIWIHTALAITKDNYNYIIRLALDRLHNPNPPPTFVSLTSQDPISNMSQYTKLLQDVPPIIKSRYEKYNILVSDKTPIIPEIGVRLHIPRTLERTHFQGY
jgi:hypothetical protein